VPSRETTTASTQAVSSSPLINVAETDHLSGAKVLIVDDEEYVRGIISDMLESMDCEPIEAIDGDEGLALFSSGQHNFQACVIDLTMPGMPGMELLDRIRKLDAQIPVLLVSGYSRHEVRQHEAKSTGISFLQKPFTVAQFKTAITAQLNPTE
jgi:two-component system cell cycle sensor histidine kinase/response regulator CckA